MISNEEREKIKDELREEILKEIRESSKTKKCENCGNEFIPIKSSSKFCSSKCYVEYERQIKKRVFRCLNCDNEFTPVKSSSKFCSYSCSIIYRRQQMANLEKQKKEQEELETQKKKEDLEIENAYQRMKNIYPNITKEEFIKTFRAEANATI